MPLRYAGDRRHDLARRAVAALEAVMIDKGLLHRVQLVAGTCEAFDCGDLAILGHDGEQQARERTLPVQMDRAGAALTVVATFLGARKPHVIMQRIEQGCPEVDQHGPFSAIDRQANDHRLPTVRAASNLAHAVALTTSGKPVSRAKFVTAADRVADLI